VLALPGELLDALREYAARANASPCVRRTLTGWTCRLHIQATDTAGARFTLQVAGGQAGSPAPGLHGVPDLVVRGHSMDLAEIFRATPTRSRTTCRAPSRPRAAPMT
jgi:hypothetical protein